MDYKNKLLNIRSIDHSQKIYDIVLEEKNNLLLRVDDISGFCKYIANQIEARLKEICVKTYLIDLYDINVDHVFLICEYRYQDEMVRYLIDPTYIQFTKDIGKKLIALEEWPSDKLDKRTLKELLSKGLVKLDNDIFNNYLNSFNYPINNIELDKYLFNIRMDKISKKESNDKINIRLLTKQK